MDNQSTRVYLSRCRRSRLLLEFVYGSVEELCILIREPLDSLEVYVAGFDRPAVATQLFEEVCR